MQSKKIVIPESLWPGKLLNVNSMRGHSRHISHRIAPWRELGHLIGLRHRGEPLSAPVRLVAAFRFPTNHRRDTGNNYPTVKALLDGLVDAGVLSDDCDGKLDGPFLVRDYPNGHAQITLSFREISKEDIGEVLG